MTEALFSTTWFGPVLYYAFFNRSGKRYIEGAENFVRQTYRNRCIIAASNGPITLSLPVENNGGLKTRIKDVKLSDHGNWQRMHWYSIESAYNSSPFFEYYSDDLKPFFEKKERWLFEYNEEIREKICDLLGIDGTAEITDVYINNIVTGIKSASHGITISDQESSLKDFREALQPKAKGIKDLETGIIKPYYQVFDRKFGFQPNLSILDLLFNMGPEAILYL